MGKGWCFQPVVLEQLDIYIQKKKINFDSYLASCPKINLKWIINLNVRAKTTKLLEQNIGVNIHDFELGNNFLDKTP